MFAKLYQWMIKIAGHPRAAIYLGGLSTLESSVFPIPPDVMLAPMVLAKPTQWYRLALITTVCSVFGGLIGYAIGYAAFSAVGVPILDFLNAHEQYEKIKLSFEHYGFGFILLAGFTPIPYKLFTIAAGTMHMSLLYFILGSALSRGARFFMLSFLLARYGNSVNRLIERFINRLGWGLIAFTLLGASILMVSGCQTKSKAVIAHVESRTSSKSTDSHYRVQKGDTLYGIAWQHQTTIEQLANNNQLAPPYTLLPGQNLSLREDSSFQKAQKPSYPSQKAKSRKDWVWPAKGRLAKKFSKKSKTTYKGIDIKGEWGSPIMAVSNGDVVYSGAGLRGYGDLVIIRHPNQLLSAYAHNHKLLVREGDKVQTGQIIARMGYSGTDETKLHFQIRKHGKPVDPMKYLKKTS